MINLLFIIFLSNFLFSESQESIYEKINLANSYAQAGLEEDAIIIYKNILSIQKDVLGEYSPELIKILFSLSDLYFKKNKKDSSEVYLNKALDIQYYNFLIKQKDYMETYNKLKNVYLSDNDSLKINNIDSLLTLLNRFDYDSLYPNTGNNFPPIVAFSKGVVDSTNLVSEYSLNDKAIELFNSGIEYLNSGLFSESIVLFDQALKVNSNIINLDFLMNASYGDSSQTKNLFNALQEITYFDSTVSTHNLFLAVLSDDLSQLKNQKIDYIKRHIIDHPEDIKGYLFIADLYFNNSQYIEAMHYYHRLLLINPNHFHANLQMAKCLIEFNDYEEALIQLEISNKLGPDNFNSKYYTGYCHYNLKNYKNSIQEFTQALLIFSEDADTYYYLGKSYLLINKKKQALEALIMSIKLNPFNGDAHFELGKIYESVLKIDLALEEYRLADKYIDNHQLNYIYGMLLFKEQRYNEALNSLREFIIYEPENIEVLEILGQIFISEYRYPEAIDTYNRLAEIYPDKELYYKNLAVSYYELENYTMSKQYYERVLIFNEENPETLLKLGSICNLLNQYNQAEEYLLESIYCGFTSKNILFELGLSYGGQKKYLQSLITLKEALEYSLDDPILHYQIGVVYQEMFIYDLAIQSYKMYAKSNSEDPIVYRLMGDCHKNLNNFQDAIINYKKAYKLYSYDDINILYHLGFCYLKINDYTNAAKYFKSIIRINPDHPATHNNLISIYAELNKLKEARKECDILFMLDRDLYYLNSFCIN